MIRPTTLYSTTLRYFSLGRPFARHLLSVFALICVVALSACEAGWESSETVRTESLSTSRQALATTSSGSLVNGDEVFLILYREKGFHGSATAFPVIYEGRRIGALKNGTFIVVKTNAGSKSLFPEERLMTMQGEPFLINAQPGSTYYLRHGLDTLWESDYKFRVVDTAEGQAQVSGMRLVHVLDEYIPSARRRGGWRVKSLTGTAFVTSAQALQDRQLEVGANLSPGDIVRTRTGSTVILHNPAIGEVKVIESSSFKVPSVPPPVPVAGEIWNQIKSYLPPDNPEIWTGTVGGVRG